MKGPLVFDTTPLIYLVKGTLTESLTKLRMSKIVPEIVYYELMAGEAEGRPAAAVMRGLVSESTLILAKPRSSTFVKKLMDIAAEGENKPLHQAEAEALAIARDLDGILIADDHVARSTAKLMQVECHGTGYLLGRMYQEGSLSKKVAMRKVTEMRKAGWRLSEDDYRAILDYIEKL